MEEFSLPQRLLGFVKNNLLISLLFSAGLICLFIGLIQYFLPKSEKIELEVTSEASADSKPEEIKTIFVDVSGQVKAPGLYEFKSQDRIKDAIEKAGGLHENADYAYVSKHLNQAAKLADGMKIYIPEEGEAEVSQLVSSGSAPEGEQVLRYSSVVSINNSSQSDLESLPGIGPVTAQKIISQRPYTSVEELVSKKSVGQSLFSKIKDQIGL